MLADHASLLRCTQLMEQASEARGRIGLVIGVKQGRLMVERAPEGSPGHRAGIRTGDHIVRIDQADTAGMDRAAAGALLRGPAGTSVVLSVARAGTSDPLRFEVLREAEAPVSLAGVGKLVLGLAGVLLFVGIIVAVTWSSTSPHRNGAKTYAELLRKNQPRDAYALVASERRQGLTYDAWLGSMNTPLLARANDMTVSSTSSNSTGRGCVRAVVDVDGASTALTFYTLAEGDLVHIQGVMTNAEQSGAVAPIPWSCN